MHRSGGFVKIDLRAGGSSRPFSFTLRNGVLPWQTKEERVSRDPRRTRFLPSHHCGSYLGAGLACGDKFGGFKNKSPEVGRKKICANQDFLLSKTYIRIYTCMSLLQQSGRFQEIHFNHLTLHVPDARQGLAKGSGRVEEGEFWGRKQVLVLFRLLPLSILSPGGASSHDCKRTHFRSVSLCVFAKVTVMLFCVPCCILQGVCNIFRLLELSRWPWASISFRWCCFCQILDSMDRPWTWPPDVEVASSNKPSYPFCQLCADVIGLYLLSVSPQEPGSCHVT